MLDDQNQRLLMGWATRRKDNDQVVADDAATGEPQIAAVTPLRVATGEGQPSRANSWAVRFRRLTVPQVIVITVALSGVYFWGIARDRYLTRSDFVVRKADEAAGLPSLGMGGIGGLLGQPTQNSMEDARYLRTYLASPQVLEDLRRQFDFDKAYARRWPDPFAGLGSAPSQARRLELFQKQVSVALDEASGVLTIRTYGFGAMDSYRLNQFLLKASNTFVNRLNQSIGAQQLRFAQRELQLSRERLERAKRPLLAFQAAAGIIDPVEEAKFKGEGIAKLAAKMAELKVEQFTLKQQFKSDQEPELLVVADQISELQRLINQERQGLVSKQGNSLNRKAADLLKLESEVTFATDLYKTTLAAAEKARVDTQRQQKFMAVLSAPLLADEPNNSWRFRGFFTVVAMALVGFSLTKFVLGMQSSHRE